jgi:hypothetical protein
MESNSTVITPILLSSNSSNTDQTGLFIGLFLLFLLFLLISYLFYSFLSFKRFHAEQHQHPPETHSIEEKPDQNIIFHDNDDLINSQGEIVLGRQNSFSDCGTSLRSSSIRSHINPNAKRSSSYKLCSQPSNFLLSPHPSSQWTNNADECLSATIIVEPNDVHLANALSRSISKYYERQRKPKIKRRTHSCENLACPLPAVAKRPLKMTASLPMRSGLRPVDRHHRSVPKQRSLRNKPTTIYELYKSDRLRIASLLVADP